MPGLVAEINAGNEVLEAERKRLNRDLSEAEATAIMKNAGMDYSTHLKRQSQMGGVRALSPYGQGALTQTNETSTFGDYRNGGGYSNAPTNPYDSTHQVFSRPLTLKGN